MYSFANLKDPINTATGLGETAMIALAEWFVPGGIKSPGLWVDYGDEVIIKDSHVFKPGMGFIQFSLAPEKNSYDAKTIGDTGLQKFANEAKIMLPGSYADLHETLYELGGKAAIVLLKDSNCAAGIWYQLGTDCIPARISSEFTTGTTKEGNKAYLLTIANTAAKVYLYEGDITYPGETDAIIARLTGEKIGDIVTLDGSTSTTFGPTVYEYTVLYNDVDDNEQSIILPEAGDSAAFNINILVNWNNAGFAIRLKITNAFTTDTTLSSDVTDQRPVIMGGFDEGFNEGFDFNI